MSSDEQVDGAALGEVVIAAEGLGKYYEIYGSPSDRLKQFLLPPLDRALGGVPKRYFREFWALKNLSFEVRKGQTIGIIGRNGSGKSTLLQLVCGTLMPSTGSVQTRGRIAALLELGSGFNPEFTGRENVLLSGALFGLDRATMSERYAAIVEFSGIGDFIEQPVKTYSSGMVVRLAFSVIAHVDADILVIDEALSVGDAYFTQKCMRFLREFMRQGTLLFCSHDMGAILNLCDYALWLDKGVLRMSGPPKAVSQGYLASLFESDGKTEESELPQSARVDSRDAAACVVPGEDIDVRQAMIDASSLRNDIEVFRFDESKAGFGTGYAKVDGVRLLDPDGRQVGWAVGGQHVTLEISASIFRDIPKPILGFVVKDKLGQIIFSDNTYLSYQDAPVAAHAGRRLVARFAFRFPVLPPGEYSISPAIAEGTQADHVQHHWVHDAMILQVHSSVVCLGLVGVPMKQIVMEAE
ncbi:ABC transporter ATP-binding protein [Luteimonas sp. FCS-9]|uniref:ABC transporter ATP-binding protein n=1 Tax=Luteimonas sp. FCS-9 TaxID=1547516 RepID=UPI00063E935A|nr:ABC transporter ATP-binding protein [Luteimonas sp. FCS-9]KLI98609.1 ABC transporter ATP-binding protein [Luteimonas sp. FCS-9]